MSGHIENIQNLLLRSVLSLVFRKNLDAVLGLLN